MAAHRVAGLLFGALFFAGCTSLPPSPTMAPPSRGELTDFSLEARFSLNQGDKNYSGRLSWQHAGSNDELMLASPFGQGMAEITSSAGGARMTTSDGKVYSAANAEMLTEQVLGYSLPLAQLTDWIRGVGNALGASERDRYGRLSRFRHESWQIEYGYPSGDPNAMPERIFAENADGFKLRMHIDAWRSLPPDAVKP